MLFNKIKTLILLFVIFGVAQGCSPFHRYIFIMESLLLENQEKNLNSEIVEISTSIGRTVHEKEKNFHSTTVYYGNPYYIIVDCYYKNPVKNIEINRITVQADDQTIDLSSNLKSNEVEKGSLVFSSIYFNIDYETLKNLKVSVDCILFMSDGRSIPKSYSYIGRKEAKTESASWILVLMGV